MLGTLVIASSIMCEVEYDVIVVGAGVVGSAAAFQLVKNGGGRLLLLEQFSALHTRGSSHGGSRITRRAYKEEFYVRMMDEAFKMWSEIEQLSKTKLYIKTGFLVFGPVESLELNKTIASLVATGVDHEVLTAEEVMLRYPHQLDLPSDHKAVFERDGGILLASKAVGALQSLFLEFGGQLLEHHKVTDVVPGDIITVTTDKRQFRTRRLVVTAGPWGPSLLQQLGVSIPFKFNIRRAEVFYWKADQPKHFSADAFPTFGFYDHYHHPFYGLPIYEYPGLVKICPHASLQVEPDDRDNDPSAVTNEIKQFVSKYFKGVAATPSIYESCIITKTLDENPIIDRHPLHSNIVFAVGFSGHGFKLAPVVGKLLAELTLNRTLSYDLSPFKMDRLFFESKL